jgi:ectoine hydroxylase-related dioxygenase (phytanoyl-CoA dioxygenase family)
MNHYLDPILNESNDPNLIRNMDECGYYAFRARVPADICRILRDKIDELSGAKDVEINYKASEHRVWQAASKANEFADFQALSNIIIPKLYGRASPAHNMLAIRNRPVPLDAERMETRWHLDSFRKQLKLFVFLSDVEENNGPFEFIPKTHTTSFKWKHAIPLGYYKLTDIPSYFQGRRSWQYIHNKTIEKLRTSGFEPEPMLVEEGTVLLADTSAIHRARPCLSGDRYAVTVYHR